jgi:hypothetical protein
LENVVGMSKIDRDREMELEARRARLHMQRTTFSERILPAIFIGLGIVTLALIIIAVTVLLGIVTWR